MSDYEAIECALRYCVKQYDSTAASSQIQESGQVIESAARASGSWKLDSVDRSEINKTAKVDNVTVTNADINDLDFKSPTVSYTRTDLMLGNQYNISQTAVNGISSLMYNTFTYDQTSEEFINGVYITGSRYGDMQYNPSASQRLWDSQNLEESFETLAVSMSNAIRARSDNNAIETGQEGSSVTKFSISWSWIALPLLVILASLTQLFVVIFSSRTVPLWKESTLAVLSRGRLVDGLFDQASTVRDMRAAAGRTKVNLFEDKTELRNLTPSTFGRIDTEYRS